MRRCVRRDRRRSRSQRGRSSSLGGRTTTMLGCSVRFSGCSNKLSGCSRRFSGRRAQKLGCSVGCGAIIAGCGATFSGCGPIVGACTATLVPFTWLKSRSGPLGWDFAGSVSACSRVGARLAAGRCRAGRHAAVANPYNGMKSLTNVRWLAAARACRPATRTCRRPGVGTGRGLAGSAPGRGWTGWPAPAVGLAVDRTQGWLGGGRPGRPGSAGQLAQGRAVPMPGLQGGHGCGRSARVVVGLPSPNGWLGRMNVVLETTGWSSGCW